MNYGIGIDDFKNVIDDAIYVDKTNILSKILCSTSGSTFLFCRPRRFGKSLALSMMDYFLDENKSQYKSLFNGLAIEKDKSIIDKHQNKYSVIHLNFKDLRGDNYDSLIYGVKNKISEIYNDCSYLKDKLSGVDLKYYDSIINKTANDQDYTISLYWLCKLLGNNKKKVIVLIDEYDSPIIASRDGNFYDKSISFFKSFYGETFKSNNYLSYGILTGFTQIAKESIFSGLNNLIVNNVFSFEEEYFGFVEDDINYLINNSKLTIDKEKLCNYYGNYLFGNNLVYNPWSVLNCLNNSGIYDYYWINTSENSLIEEVIETSKQSDNTLQIIYDIISKNSYRGYIDSGVSFKDLNQDDELISLLVASGYLTIKEKKDDDTYLIGIPNIEIRKVFNKEIAKRYMNNTNKNIAYSLSDSLRNRNIEDIEDKINSYLLNAFSSYEMNNEKAYQVLVLTMCSMVFSNHLVKAEQNVGKGRCDIIIYPNYEDRIGIVIETKYYKSKVSNAVLNNLAIKALEQIEEQDYISDLKKMDANPIYTFGFAFSSKRTKIVSKEN